MTKPSPKIVSGSSLQPRPPGWTREQIRAARLTPLLPILEKRGVALVEQGSGNFQLPAYPGLIVKDGYWRWPDRGQAGNAIDFCTRRTGAIRPGSALADARARR